MSEDFIIEQCAPTLAGIKTGNLFTCPYDTKEEVQSRVRELNRLLVPKGLCLLPMRYSAKRVLLYLYSPSRLKRDLSDERAVGRHAVRRHGEGVRPDNGGQFKGVILAASGVYDKSCARVVNDDLGCE